MSISCTNSPTRTSLITFSTTFPTTTFTDQVITASPTITAIGSISTCLGYLTPILSLSAISPICTSSGVVTQYTTIGGGVQTTRISVVQTITSTVTSVVTYYGSSCTTFPTSKITKPTTATLTHQSETTLNDGRVSTTVVTFTTLLVPSLGSDTEYDAAHETPVGSIIGGIVGSIVGLLVLATAIWILIKRRREKWSAGGRDHGTMESKSRFSLSAEFDEDDSSKPHQDVLSSQQITSRELTSLSIGSDTRTKSLMSEISGSSLLRGAEHDHCHTRSSEPHSPSSSYPFTQSSWIPIDSTENPFATRAGSPVSFTESQGGRLQVTNASPPSLYGDVSNANVEDNQALRPPTPTTSSLPGR